MEQMIKIILVVAVAVVVGRQVAVEAGWVTGVVLGVITCSLAAVAYGMTMMSRLLRDVLEIATEATKLMTDLIHDSHEQSAVTELRAKGKPHKHKVN